MRVAYRRQQAEGLMTIEELRAHLVELDERKAEAESELEALRDSRRRLDELRAYPGLVSEYLKELPYLVHRTEGGIRDHAYTEEHEERMRQTQEEGRLPIFTVSPEIFRVRPTEEMEELRRAQDRDRAERYKNVYTSLGLTAIAHKDGTLELIWKAGEGVSEVCDSPRCTVSATTSS